ncbi:MAG: DNA polymerase I [Myxococcales bacterium]|nr:DNA polymerase I [Myxococcales bacterium]MCB9708314.1 DNA polymerase I [Myxococcales bacterium]
MSQLPAPGDERTLYVLDVSGYVFRAYHALPDLANSKGEPTHAVFGTLNMLRKLLAQQTPAYLAVAMDSKLPSFRHTLYEQYKANRPPAPADLSQQMARVRQIITAYRICCLEHEGVEADDLIASLVREARRRDLQVVIVSADKDLLQLVDKEVWMYDTMRERVFGMEEVKAKLGITSAQVRDYLALTGDASDNIPGVPKVGPKTAVSLLEQWKNLDGIYAHIGQIKRSALRASLIAHRSDAYLSYQLVGLKDELPLELDWASLRYNGPDADALATLFKELEFSRPSEAVPPSPVSVDSEHVTTVARLRASAEELRGAEALLIATLGTAGAPGTLFAMGVAPFVAGTVGAVKAIAMTPAFDGSMGGQEVREVLGPLLEDVAVPKYSASVKHDSLALASIGIAPRGWAFDAMLASYVLEPDRRGHDLASLAERHLNLALRDDRALLQSLVSERQTSLAGDAQDFGAAAQTLAERVTAIAQLAPRLIDRIAQAELTGLLSDVEIPLALVLADLERTGIGLDTDHLDTLSKEVNAQLGVLEAKCHELAGQVFNLNAPRKLEAILFDHLKLPVIKRTKTARSTDHSVLEQLAIEHPLPAVILEHRTLAKLKSTYLDALPKQINPQTGRIHTCFNQAVAATGRLSSSDPNLQNIPIRNAVGRRIREAFVPQSGWWLLSADYSQIELRILAHLSQDPELLQAYRTRQDVHARTAEAIFGVSPEAVTAPMRAQAKTVNFAVIYGQTDFALSRHLKITRAQAKNYIEAFFLKYAGVKQFMEQVVEHTRAHGYVRTLLGRRRPIADIQSSNRNLRMQAERIAANTPIQGSAADVMKVAMLRIHDALREQDKQSRMLLTVHDEIVLEVPEQEKNPVETLVKEAMENAVPLSVPLKVEVGFGRNWGEAH